MKSSGEKSDCIIKPVDKPDAAMDLKIAGDIPVSASLRQFNNNKT